MSMKYDVTVLGPVMTNCYIVYDTETMEAMVIDPSWSCETIAENLQRLGVTLKRIVLTHGHADHIGALQDLRQRYQVPVYVGAGDKDLITNSRNNMSLFVGKEIVCDSPDYIAEDGDIIAVGKLQFKVITTPGHTPGGICLYGSRTLFSGDTLFRYSVGRTDLYGGAWETLLQSINDKLMVLPDSTLVLPGHGPATTIGEERTGNPYLDGDGGW
ncbi:MBL fold metallo-hydrolase [uncultured Megasphaera sp.]|uniref:MBL fold metallo-hydrolase n=1 Tax=uncultured Megasphaera sp. TaxID=165188 RepID=UPI0007849FD5|nr:MBL fold metallo-hydrolase [uncultured Megasphaera sp.]KXB91387.1 metallo-beta-lactamase domain protein [Veillonellaceae bacterium DNF00751]MUP49386.1 MBL fold metallo-hydrolase [Veillonellaceae bacterium M1-70]